MHRSTPSSSAPSSLGSASIRALQVQSPSTWAPKPSVIITLNNNHPSRVYTSGSTIAGTAAVLATRDVPFDSIEIVFLGTIRTCTNAVHFTRQVSRVILRMNMPIDSETSYPVPRVFEAGRVYEFPFVFVVPYQLTISSCEHLVDGDHVRAEHLALPPTVGHWASPAAGGRDDLAPDMTQIEYVVKATVLSQPDLNKKPIRLMAGVQQINILPASFEAPPLDISGPAEKVYTLRKTKSIRKGILSAKLGRLTASTSQPRPIFLSPDGRLNASSYSAANVYLSFAPSASSSDTPPTPPKIHSVTAKISATTHFSTTPLRRLPNLSFLGAEDFATSDITVYTSSHTLFAAGFDQVPWRLAASRRDSGYGSDQYSSPSSSEDQQRSHAKLDEKQKQSSKANVQHASLCIPFTLPTNKLFLPTFHSCLMSRTYTLHLSISAGPTNTSIHLAVPLQIAVEQTITPREFTLSNQVPENVESEEVESAGGIEGLPTFEAAMAEREADTVLRPRPVGGVDDRYGGGSPTMLPSYGTAVAYEARV